MNTDCATFIDMLKRDDAKHKIIYISIGSAAHMAKWDNGEIRLDKKYDQQYPECIRELRDEYKDTSLYIILLDPSMESPPYIVKDKHNITRLVTDDKWKKTGNIYHNSNENICVLNIDKAVTCRGYKETSKCMDITPLLDTINNLAKINNWFVLAHDFSGRNIGDVAEYYDDMLTGHKNHIIYGIGYRFSSGCYIDLCSDTSKFICESGDDGGIKVFNPYNYSLKQNKEIGKTSGNPKIKSIVKMVFDNAIKKFKNNVLSIYRRLLVMKSHYNRANTIIIEDTEYEYVNKKYNINFTAMYEKEPAKLITIIEKIMIDELGEILFLIDKTDVMKTVSELIAKREDPYKLSEYVSKILVCV